MALPPRSFPAPSTDPGERLAALEGLRGYAVLLVFLVHAFGLLATRLWGIDPDLHSVWNGGDPARTLAVLAHRSHYGVDLFFVLSGLLMADLALRRWPGTPRFLARRWLRIYPAYAVSSLVAGLVAAFWLERTLSPAQAWGNAALLQGFFVLGIPAVNAVTWSLSYEAAFYLAVPALAAAWASPRHPPGPATLAILFAIIVAGAWLAPWARAIYFAYFALFLPGIALGVLSARERERLAAAIPLPAVLAAWVAFTLAVKLEAIANTGPAYYAASGVASGLLVLKACDPAGALARALSSPVPLWLGRHSYSFFLIHYVVVHGWGAFVASTLSQESRVAQAAVFLAGSLALSLAAARLLYVVAERFYFRRR